MKSSSRWFGALGFCSACMVVILTMVLPQACTSPIDAEPSTDASQTDKQSQDRVAPTDRRQPPELRADTKDTEPAQPDRKPEQVSPDRSAPEKLTETAKDSIPETPLLPDIDRSKRHRIPIFQRTRINSRGKVNVRNAYANFDMGQGPFKRVRLIIDLDTTCYPFTKWQSNRPPAGQNWPADCDAYDRTFKFNLDPPKKGETKPAIELVRAITPFGGPMHLEIDVTDVANGLPGQHRMHTHIGTWSDGKGRVSGSNGGWFVSAYLDVEPGLAPRKVLAVIPLYNGGHNNKSGKKDLTLTVPAGTQSSRVEYRVTGHGGGKGLRLFCIGHADEFCRRTHKVYVDGKLEKTFIPWRDDCQKGCTLAKYGNRTYCKENPCGNIQSVRAPRANWCPGSLTPPYTWNFASFSKPGKHTFSYEILRIANGGSWSVSATYFAYGTP